MRFYFAVGRLTVVALLVFIGVDIGLFREEDMGYAACFIAGMFAGAALLLWLVSDE